MVSIALYILEKLGVAYPESIDNSLERTEAEISVALFDVCQIASINSCHQRKFRLRDVVLPAKFFNPQTDFVSYIRLSHFLMLVTMIYRNV